MSETATPTVPVDSGSIMIVDPCRVFTGPDWGPVAKKMIDAGGVPGPIEYSNGLIFQGFGGDGSYRVEAEHDEETGLLLSLKIVFHEAD